MKTTFLLTALLFLFSAGQGVFAQAGDCVNEDNGWCWGEDPGTAKEKYTLFSDGITFKDYKTSSQAFAWLMENVPNLNKALYIKGVNLYEDMLDAEEKGGNDPAKIKEYQDKILSLYDQRIELFGERADVLERKGKRAYFFWKDREDPDKWNKMYDLYKEVFEANGNETSGSNITFYMLSAVNLVRRKKITEEETMAVYDKVSEVIEYNVGVKKGSQQDRWEDMQGKIDALFSQGVDIDCDFVREKMGETIRNKPEDITTSKRAIKYMLNGKCTDDPLFLVAAENVFAVEPAAGLATTIGKIYQSSKDYDKAIEWKEKAIELTEGEPEEQGKIYYEIAQIKSVQGKLAESRKNAFKAVELDPNMASQAYTLVGDLYFNSGNACQTSSPVKSKANYFAAYDMYQKAGNSSRMSQAAQGFPTISEIFLENMEEGQKISIDCWIGGSTTVRRRPSDN